MFEDWNAALLVLISVVLPIALMFGYANHFEWASINRAGGANSRKEQTRYERAALFPAVCTVLGLVGLASSLGLWKEDQLKQLESTKAALEAPAIRVESFRLQIFANTVRNPDYLQTDQGRRALEMLERESSRQQVADAVTMRPRANVLEAHEFLTVSLAAFLTLVGGGMSGSFMNLAMTIGRHRAIEESNALAGSSRGASARLSEQQVESN